MKLREEVSHQDKWNVEALYPSLQDWEKEFSQHNTEGKQKWPAINSLKGHLGENPETLKKSLELILKADRALSKLYTYAHLRNDEDIANDLHKAAQARIVALIHEFNQSIAWFEPEILALPESTLNTFLKSETLAPYKFHLEKIVRIKKHTLTAEKEELMAYAVQALDTPYKAFNALSDADFVFGTVQDSAGKSREVTHGAYGLYMRDHDRVLRERAFKKMHGHFLSYKNSLTELISGQMKKDLFQMRARGYKSCLEASLFPKNIDTSVYHALIKAVNDNIGKLHKYIALRKKIMKLPTLHLYDMYVPLTSSNNEITPYNVAEDMIIESVAPLGSDYQNLLKKGMKEQRWVDRYENKNKRSGGYSSGCYDSMPYILMNYKGILKDVFTLAHEAGHSMHSLLSRTSQPYHYSDYSIFLAEVASTFNEELLMHQMLKHSTKKEEKIFLINEKIEDLRGTLFRQTMFAEFELLLHEKAEQNIPLTPGLLKEEYRKLNAKYFGPDVTIDEEAEAEWARIPHFYYNFYVYQYATGISAAMTLADGVLKGGQKERDAYLNFLKSGCSNYPIDSLQKAGVDMRTPTAVKLTIDKFGKLVDELEKLLAV